MCVIFKQPEYVRRHPYIELLSSLVTHTHTLTRALLLITGPDLLSRAVALVALQSAAFTHPEATLGTGVARLAAETPVVPVAPVTSTWSPNTAPPVKLWERGNQTGA